jgi:hypothetical protein
MTDTQTAFVLASQIAADVMGNDHLAHLLDEQQADEVHSHVQEAVLKALLSAAPKPPESEIGPVANYLLGDAHRRIEADRDIIAGLRVLAKKLSNALVQLTPGGSEYYTKVGEDYYADTEACLEVIRDRFASGHQAKIDRVDAERRAEAAEARVKALEATIGGCHCPRPFNSRPHGFTIAECVGAGECGCSDGEALASKTATDTDREAEIQRRNRDEDALRDSIEGERDE